MAKYGIPYYGGTKYGDAPKLNYSVEPITLTVLSFSTAFLEWQNPRGSFTRIRLVRSQSGIPETQDDGLVIWEEAATEGTVSRLSFTDGVDNPSQSVFATGKEVFYAFFLFTAANVWVNAGSVAGVIPSDHGMQTTMLNSLPRVYTTVEQSPLGEPSTTSDLANFLDGLSFTFEEFSTYLDILRPAKVNMPAPLLASAFQTYGLVEEPNIPTHNQKRLVREAIYMYSRKGTALGLGAYCESLTGYAPTLTVSTNLMLSPQDSTFYSGIGNWSATNATLTATDEQVPASGDNVIDTTYSGKIVASSSGSMSVGTADPILYGVPVLAGTDYVVSCQHKSPSSAGNITLSIKWYDGTGTFISTASSTASPSINAWTLVQKTSTAPSTAVYATVTIAYSAAGTYYVDQVCVQPGTTASYDEARAIDVFLAPHLTNYIKNPSFEVNTTDDWTLAGSATVSQDTDVSDLAYSGSNSAKIVATGNWTYTSNVFPITVGTYYVASGLLKTDADITISYIGRDGGGVITETGDVYPLGTISDWSRFSATELTDAIDHGDVVTYEIVFSGGAGTFYIDCVQVEKGISPTEYFDGSLPSQFGAVWEGTADNSYSHLYPNKPFKIPRLAYTIDNWITPNTMWRIRTYGGTEYTSHEV